MDKKSTTALRRAFRRSVVAAFVAVLLGLAALPASSSAQTLHGVHNGTHVVLPADGVGDSPPVP